MTGFVLQGHIYENTEQFFLGYNQKISHNEAVFDHV